MPRKILDQLKLVDVEYISFDHKLHRGQIVIHKYLVDEVKMMFELAVEVKFPIAKVVPNSHPDYKWDTKKLVIENNVTGGFGYRKIKGTDKLSLHSYGRAIDINPLQNPYIRYKNSEEIVFPPNTKWNPKRPGTLHKNNPLVKFMESKGWE